MKGNILAESQSLHKLIVCRARLLQGHVTVTAKCIQAKYFRTLQNKNWDHGTME